MHILKYRIRNEWWKRQISKRNPLIRKNVFTLAWGGFCLPIPKSSILQVYFIKYTEVKFKYILSILYVAIIQIAVYW